MRLFLSGFFISGGHFCFFLGSPITIHGSNMMMLSSRQALKPFADQSLVEQSANHVLPEMFPVSPLIDLKEDVTESWNKTNSLGSNVCFVFQLFTVT